MTQQQFKKGDKVRLVDQEAHGGAWKGPMTVDEPHFFTPRIGVIRGSSLGAFWPDELELIASMAYSKPDEPEEPPQAPAELPAAEEFVEVLPDTYEEPEQIVVKGVDDIRIVVKGIIGTTQYASKYQAVKAARRHGHHDEEFELVNIVNLGKYRLKTEVIPVATH
jgi:hypothetical protein